MSDVPHYIPVDRDCDLLVFLNNNGALSKEQLKRLVNQFDGNVFVYVTNNVCLITNKIPKYVCTTCKNLTDIFEISNNTLYTKYSGSNECSIRTCCSCEMQCFSEYFQHKRRMPCTTYDVKKQTFVSQQKPISTEELLNKRRNKNEKPGPLIDQTRPGVKNQSFDDFTYTEFSPKIKFSQLVYEDKLLKDERQMYYINNWEKTKKNFHCTSKNKCCVEYFPQKRQTPCTICYVKSQQNLISIKDKFNKRQNKNERPGPLIDLARPRKQRRSFKSISDTDFILKVKSSEIMTEDKNLNKRKLYSKDNFEKPQEKIDSDTPKYNDQTLLTDQDCVRIKRALSEQSFSQSSRCINSVSLNSSCLPIKPLMPLRIRKRIPAKVLPASPLTVSISKDTPVWQRIKEKLIVISCNPLNDAEFDLPLNDAEFDLPLNDAEFKFPIQATDGPHENVEQDSAPVPTIRAHLSFNTTRRSELLNCRYPEFADKSRRVATFVHWPHCTDSSSMDTGKMADSGLFFTGPFDLVRCYSCGLGMKDWAPGDDCLLEHIRFSPRCEHLITTTDPDILQSYRARVEQRNHQQARHPHYASREARLGSFETWSNNGHQTPEELTDAGFFYTGQEDRTRCYYCDGGLQHWDEGDEPWIEHARWFPNCEHVRRIKGELFIETVQAALRSFEEDETEGATGYIETDMAALHINGTGKESEDPIYNPMAQNVITLFGFSQAAVRIAIQECAEQGRRWNTEILANILYDKQERGEVLPVDSPRPSSPAQPPIDINTDEGLLAEHRRLLNIVMCIQCEDNEANILFLPCAHRRFCSECARDVTMCPICTKPVKEKVRTYMA